MNQNHEIIAERVLEILNQNDTVTIQVFKPQPDKKEGGDYGCSFLLMFRDIIEEQTIYGIDSFQALYLTLKIIPTYLSNFLKRMKLELDPNEKLMIEMS